jgi:hypothetical protein
MCIHWPNLPSLFAAQLCGRGWAIWAPIDDPCGPAVRVVDVLVEPAYSTAVPQQGNVVRIRAYRATDRKPAAAVEAGDANLAGELLCIADLLRRLRPPDHHQPWLFHDQVDALMGELRSMARRVRRTA